MLTMKRKTLMAILLLLSTRTDISVALVSPRSYNVKSSTLSANQRLLSSVIGMNGAEPIDRYAADGDFQPR